MSWEIRQGDCLPLLREMDAGSVQCIVTSPPYWGLRDYGSEGQLGLEKTPDEYVSKLVEVFREVRRALRDDGCVFLNLGDSYYSNGTRGESLERTRWGADKRGDYAGYRTREQMQGLKPKDLVGIPWRVAFALQQDGWYLRSDIVWSKPNPMPESVTDRPTRSHEYVFLLTKSARYFFDQEAVREEAQYGFSSGGFRGGPGRYIGGAAFDNDGDAGSHGTVKPGDGSSGRNIRSVWNIATQPYSEAHFATFPTKLVEPCILAGSAESDLVLDPFCGSGTVGVVALRHNRSFIGLELNPSYCEMARNRIRGDAPLLNTGLEVAA